MELDAKFYYLCRLEIANVDARDIGCYKAVARNASGEGHATINLTFEEGKAQGRPMERVDDTVWKNENFSTTLILREITFGKLNFHKDVWIVLDTLNSDTNVIGTKDTFSKIIYNFLQKFDFFGEIIN